MLTPADDEASMTGIVLRQFAPGREAEGEAIQQEITATVRNFEGYLGYEIFPPVPGIQEGHVVIYRYATYRNLRTWLDSEERRKFLERFEPLLARPALEFHFAGRRQTGGTHSTVLAYRLKPGKEKAFADWRHRVLEVMRKQPGYLGTESFQNIENGVPYFIAILRFNSGKHLDRWMNSNTRAGYLKELDPLIEHYEVRRRGTGLEGWFEFGAQPKPSPARWRQWLMILGALFPVIMALKTMLDPISSHLPPPVAFLLLLMIDVAVLTYFVMPRFSALMDFWLRPAPDATWRTEAAGIAILVALIATTLAVALCLPA